MIAAANRSALVQAVVSRGGRPDLAGPELEQVIASTLLVVGERDETVIELNKRALKLLKKAKNKNLEIVRNASHLFEEPGALEEVSRLATSWFLNYME